MLTIHPRLKSKDLEEIESFLSKGPRAMSGRTWVRDLNVHAEALLTEVKALKKDNDDVFKSQLEMGQALSVVRQQRDTLEYLATKVEDHVYEEAQERMDLMWALLDEVWLQSKSGRLPEDGRLATLCAAIQAKDKAHFGTKE